MYIQCRVLEDVTPEIVAAFDRWENDSDLIPFVRPNRTEADLKRREPVTREMLAARLKNHCIFLVYEGERLIGEVNYQVDPPQLYRKAPGSAWIGITIGEADVRGMGAGTFAMRFLETEVRTRGLKRIELGVFEFNNSAINLYRKLDYNEIARIPNFTFYQGRLWQDIRMEKHL